jgi:hypothetical protein
MLKFGSTQDTHQVNKAAKFLKMGRPMALKIGLEANRARARSGPARSHPEHQQPIKYRNSISTAHQI